MLLLVLGAWMATLRPRRPVATAFAVFSGFLGATYVLVNLLTPDEPAWTAVRVAGWLLLVPAFVALAGLAWWFPGRGGPKARRAALLAAGPALVQGAVVVAHILETLPLSERNAVEVAALTLRGFLVAASFVVLAFALHARSAPASDARKLALASAALLLFPGFVAGGAAAGTAAGEPVRAAAELGPFVLVAALWLDTTRRADPSLAPTARRVAWLALAVPILGMVARGLLGQLDGTNGLARTATVLVLAYAVLRQQLLGLDLRVKWTVKQSTVAAAFIGVFFVVSESASSFLATEGGLGTYLGIAAAGLLVFAIAPLQRAAERVASAAMPGVKAPSTMTSDERLGAYREAARAAWRDGVLSRDEREVLEALRTYLRLSHDEAQGLEREVSRA